MIARSERNLMMMHMILCLLVSLVTLGLVSAGRDFIYVTANSKVFYCEVTEAYFRMNRIALSSSISVSSIIAVRILP